MKLPLYKIVLVILDFFFINLSFLLAMRLRFMPEIDMFHFSKEFIIYDLIIFSFISLLILFFFESNLLYKYQVFTTRWNHFQKILKVILINVLICWIICTYIFNLGSRYQSRLAIFYFISISIIFFVIYRVIIVRKIFLWFHKKGYFKRKVIIYGAGKRGEQIKEKTIHNLKWEFMGYIDDNKKENREKQILGGFDKLIRISRFTRVDTVIIAIDRITHKRLQELIHSLKLLDVRILIISDLYEILGKTQKLEYIEGLPIVDVNYNSSQFYLNSSKRLIDIVLSFTGLLILFPAFIIIALIIKLSSKGPVIFTQKRIGKDGKEFYFYKFRSMRYNNGSEIHEQFAKEFITGNGDQSEVKKLTDDPRITRVGKFLRKTSLDEMPQLFNVLKNNMSLVGPRPCLPYEYEEYKDWHKARFMVKPGCTGVWQVCGRSKVTFDEMVVMDYYYIHNMSPWLDFKLMMQTIPVMVNGHGGF